VSTTRSPRALWHVHCRLRLGDGVFISGDVIPQGGTPELEAEIRHLHAAGYISPLNDAAQQLAELWTAGLRRR